VSAAWNQGRVLVPMDAPWADRYIEEHCLFTGAGDKHDDQVDATAHAWNILYRGAPKITQDNYAAGGVGPMRLWNVHGWFEYETTPFSAETIEDTAEDGELGDAIETTAEVMESLETCSHPEIIPYDDADEDHAKGLPDEGRSGT